MYNVRPISDVKPTGIESDSVDVWKDGGREKYYIENPDASRAQGEKPGVDPSVLEKNISSVFALAPTLALFSVPRTDKCCNQLSIWPHEIHLEASNSIKWICEQYRCSEKLQLYHD